MKTCPNPKCKTTGIPDEAKFCPNCGTMLQKEEPAKRMTLSECCFVPNVIKKGEVCELRWRGTNVRSVVIDGVGYNTRNDIFLSPAQSREYDIQFVGEDGQSIKDKLYVTVRSPYLFEGKGQPSEIKGRLIVDIRQCERTQGLGWDGKYEFQGGMPVGYDGFYAVFDMSYSIQILVIHRQLNTIFLSSGDYTVKIWRGEMQNTRWVEEGWFIFKETVPEIDYKIVTYYGLYKNNELVPYTIANEKKSNIQPIMDKLTSTYKDVFQKFSGLSLEQLVEDAEDYESYITKQD